MKKTVILLFALFAATGMFAQIGVSGTIIDEMGEPLIGVSVLVEGTSTGTITDFDGFYSLTVADNATLVFSYVGYQTERRTVAGNTTINLTMKPDDKVLDEVVVVGYGVAKSKDLTAPIASVKGDELSKQIASSPMGALQGKVSGVQVTQSGAPGSSPDVKIRGVGSIGDYAKPLYVVDGAFVDNIDFLSAEDIESLTILKDASAAAIYGVRAANGVVLVTTKKGEFGHVNVGYKGYVGIQVPTNIMKLANKAQYVELRNMAFQNTKGYVPVSESDYPGDTDWYATLTKNALIHSHALDVSGATDKTNYSVGLNYFYQDGIMNYGASNYDRLNFRARMDQKATSWLNIGINNIFSNYKRVIPNNDAYFKAFVNPPVYNVYDQNNTDAFPEPFDSPNRYGFPVAYGNPAATAYYNDNKEHGIKDVFSIYAELHFLEDRLKFKTSYNMEFAFWDQRNYVPVYFVGGAQGSDVSSLTKTYGYSTNQIIDNVLSYQDQIEAHHFSVMVGQSTRMYYSGWETGKVYDVPNYSEASKYLATGSYKNQTVTDGATRYNGVSAFLRASYNYHDRYLATFTFRADGSSKYQEKWGYFPSIGLGWNITQEDFMKGQKAFDNLKLRASWGLLGNDNIPANSTQILGVTGIAASAVFGDNLVDGIAAQTVLQNFLKWEVVNETNVGVDFATLKNRLTGELDFFYRNTENVVFYVPIASGGGTTELLANNGTVNNTGVELTLNWSDKVGDFRYNLGFNATYIRNKVLKLEGRDYIPGAAVNGDYATRTQVGYPIGAFWGYEVEGVYESEVAVLKDPVSQTIKDAGYFKYKDQNGDKVISEEDKTYLGSAIPPVMLGLNFGFDYKGLDFAISFTSQVGNKILNQKRMNRSVFPDANYDLDYYKHAWRPDNTKTNYPSPEAFNSSYTMQCNSFYVEDGSFIRIQNVQVGYNITQIPGIKNMRVYLSAQNPFSYFRYNGFTTEIGGSPITAGVDNSVYPSAATYSFGLNLNF